ncbi:MAG: hypothetical protein L6Q73_09970 [Aquabacterium sp.]|nr:hypothetical protein [Aquabacterium sp.]
MHIRLGLGLLAIVAYAWASHWLMVHAAQAPWAVAALLGPLLLPLLGVAWRQRNVWLLGLGLAGVVALVQVVAAGGLGDVRRLYLLQHVGMHLALGAGFAASLRAPGPALISRMAQRVHRELTPQMRAYTEALTGVWVAYFFGMAVVSVAVYVWGHWETWSLLANVLTPLAIGVLLVGEHGVRYRLHPEFERVSLMETVRAFRGSAAGHG